MKTLIVMEEDALTVIVKYFLFHHHATVMKIAELIKCVPETNVSRMKEQEIHVELIVIAVKTKNASVGDV